MANVGVAYESGSGDYAEWLERLDPKENISAGDIIAVIGGQITKDLTNAQQVMAVSHRPIVLGNIPAEGKNYLGNNIAFMGQIPVKIMGPVKTGDYIVGKGDLFTKYLKEQIKKGQIKIPKSKRPRNVCLIFTL